MDRETTNPTEQNKTLRSLTIKLPHDFDMILRAYVQKTDTDLSKLTRLALREKLRREGAFS